MGAGVAAGAGGIGQSFLVSSKFLDVDPEFGQGILWVGHWVYLPMVEGWIHHCGLLLLDVGPQKTVPLLIYILSPV